MSLVIKRNMTLEAARAADGAYNEDGPTIYKVVQGTVFLKRDKEPTSRNIVKLSLPVGKKLHSTGYTWKGPQGGTWAELNESRSKEVGWMLVEGPGFGVQGPLLMDEAAEEVRQVVKIKLTDSQDAIFSCTVPKEVTIRTIIEMLCDQTGLENKEVVLTKGLPAKSPDGSGRLLPLDYTRPQDILSRDATVAEADITDVLNLVYMDELPPNLHLKVKLTRNSGGNRHRWSNQDY